MKCDVCKKNEATFHSIKKVGGVTTERHLCDECRRKESKPSYNLMHLAGLGDIFSGLSDFIEPQYETAICPSCGQSADEFMRTGFVGCSNCYKAFANVILPVIKKMQGDVQHVGKVPVGLEGSVSNEYERLKRELSNAIALENYEQATIIRDRMRQLKDNQ